MIQLVGTGASHKKPVPFAATARTAQPELFTPKATLSRDTVQFGQTPDTEWPEPVLIHTLQDMAKNIQDSAYREKHAISERDQHKFKMMLALIPTYHDRGQELLDTICQDAPTLLEELPQYKPVNPLRDPKVWLSEVRHGAVMHHDEFMALAAETVQSVIKAKHLF